MHSCHVCMIITDSSVIEDLLTAFHYQQDMYNETGGREEGERERERRRRSIDRDGEESAGGKVVVGVAGRYHRMAG